MAGKRFCNGYIIAGGSGINIFRKDIPLMFKWIKIFFGGRKAQAATLSLITAASVSAGAFLGLAGDKGAPMTAQFEGMVLSNYIDIVGVETWCVGETQVGRLETGYTKEYCEMLFKQQFNQYSARLYDCYDAKAKENITPAMHAAFTDVYYNTGARCKTSMIKELKAGNPVNACNAMLLYKTAGGKDCSVRSNGCYGVWDRRVKMHSLCLADAKLLEANNVEN